MSFSLEVDHKLVLDTCELFVIIVGVSRSILGDAKKELLNPMDDIFNNTQAVPMLCAWHVVMKITAYQRIFYVKVSRVKKMAI